MLLGFRGRAEDFMDENSTLSQESSLQYFNYSNVKVFATFAL